MNAKGFPRSADLGKGRYSEAYGLYNITKCCSTGADLSDNQRQDVVDALLYFRGKGKLYLQAFVVMPDHFHLLMNLTDAYALDICMNQLERRASFPSRSNGSSMPWQERFHDHKIRSGESVLDLVNYIEQNPVRGELVEKAEDWQWSSANPEYEDKLDREFLGLDRWE